MCIGQFIMINKLHTLHRSVLQNINCIENYIVMFYKKQHSQKFIYVVLSSLYEQWQPERMKEIILFMLTGFLHQGNYSLGCSRKKRSFSHSHSVSLPFLLRSTSGCCLEPRSGSKPIHICQV